MKRRVISYVSAALLAVMTMAGLSSCIYDYVDEEAAAGKTEDNRFTLYILLGILDGPKSRVEETPKEELMHSIRIVLLDSEGKVEFNKKFSYNEPVPESGFIQIPTVKGQKQLFFFANEESVTLAGDTQRSLTDLLDSYPAGAEGFEAAVNAAAFSLAPGEPLLMTSRYSLDAGRSGENNYTFYVVPAATKFTFNITNKRDDGATVIKKIAIASLADINYVMPHVGAQYRNWENDDGTTTSLYWIDWLQRVVEETNKEPNNTNPDNLEVNRNRGWIDDYKLPDNPRPQHAPLTMFNGGPDGQGVSVAGASTNAEGEPVYGTETFGPYYATESIFLNSNGKQEYTLQLELTDGTGKKPELSPRSLPFVPALFRNTHVVIDITFEMSYMHVYGEIKPWSENGPAYGWLTEKN